MGARSDSLGRKNLPSRMLRKTLTLALLASLALVASGKQLADQFVERGEALGLAHHSLAGFDRVGMMGSISDWCQTGIAIGDVDGDGDPDLVVCGGLLGDHVFRNDGVLGYVDVTDQSGVQHNELSRMPALGDYDGDGDLDLFITVLAGGVGPLEGRSMLWRNNGLGVFENVTDLAGVGGHGHSLYAHWFDIDRDGLLDIYLSEFHSTKNLYYRNNGDGTFTESGKASGLNWPGSAHASAILDSDGDGGLDLFVANDWLATHLAGLGGNKGDGQLSGAPAGGNAPFSNVSVGSDLDVTRGIMGLAWGDPDYDGDLDLYKTDVGPNFLFINNGWPTSGQPWVQGQVTHGIVAGSSPWHETPGTFGINSSWAPLFFSADFDLWDDFYVTQGHVAGMNATMSFLPRNEPDNFFWGVGPGLPFVEDALGAGLYEEVDNRGLAAGDMDMDGDLDLFVTPTTGRLRYFENEIDPNGQGWLQVVPETHTSAPGGAGTIVRFTDSAGYVHTRALGADGPTASQHEMLAHFGLGTEPSVDVAVTFASGITITYPGTLPNTRITAVEPKLFELSARVLPIASEAPTGVDRLTVDLYAFDSAGTPLDATAIVLIDVVGLTPKGAVLSLGGNHFQREFDLAQTAGLYTVDLLINGWTPDVLPIARFRGGADPVGTQATVHPVAVRAGTADTFKIVVAPKDALGMTIGAGLPIQIDLPSANALGSTVDLGDGRYSREFLAPSTAGFSLAQIANGPMVLPSTVGIESAGTADGFSSEIMQFVPVPLQASSPDEIRVMLTPRDSGGRRLGPAAKVTIELFPTPPPTAQTFGLRHPAAPGSTSSTSSSGPATGSATGSGSGGGSASAGTTPTWPKVTLRKDIDSSGQEDGEFIFVLEKTPGMVDDLPTGTMLIRVDGQVVTTVPYSFAY